jgi:hypothetical protein
MGSEKVNEVIDALLRWAEYETQENPAAVLAQVDSQDWSEANWAQFMPDALRDLWRDLSLEARLIAYVNAHDRMDGFDADVALR